MNNITKAFLVFIVGILLYPASFAFADDPIPQKIDINLPANGAVFYYGSDFIFDTVVHSSKSGNVCASLVTEATVTATEIAIQCMHNSNPSGILPFSGGAGSISSNGFANPGQYFLKVVWTSDDSTEIFTEFSPETFSVMPNLSAPIITNMTNDTGFSDTDGFTNDNQPTFTGTSSPNKDIILSIVDSCGVLPPDVQCANWVIGTTTSDSSGNWSIQSISIIDGTWKVVAMESDVPISSDIFHLTVDTIFPDAPVITSPELSYYSNELSTLNIMGTCDDKFIINFKYKGADNVIHPLSDFYSLNCDYGTFNSKIESLYLLDENNKRLKFPITVFAVQTDFAGNASPISNEFIIKNPTFSTTIEGMTPDIGINGEHLSSTDQITFYGTTEPDRFLGIKITRANCLYTCIGSYFASGTADSDGKFSIPNLALGIDDGTYDAFIFGQSDRDSDFFTFTVDTVAPVAPVILSPLSGPYQGGDTYTVTGTCDATVDHLNFTYETMQESDGPVSKIGNNFSTDTPCAADGTFTQTFPSEFNVYPFKFAVVQIDKAGNMSPASNIIIVEAPVVTPPSGGGGGGGGGGNPTVCTRVMGDINCDEKVDKYDFSLMMMVWGYKTKDNADLNTDLSIDKYDFSLLMTNWGYGVIIR